MQNIYIKSITEKYLDVVWFVVGYSDTHIRPLVQY